MLWHPFHSLFHRASASRQLPRAPLSRIGRLGRLRGSVGPSVWLVPLAFGGMIACSDLSGMAGKQKLPTGIPDPSSINTRAGALNMYQYALAAFQMSQITSTSVGDAGSTGSTVTNHGAFVDFVLIAGLLTDELGWGDLGGVQTDYSTSITAFRSPSRIDTRRLSEGLANGKEALYAQLEVVRNVAHLASAALTAYDTVDSPALRGQMYALEGYSIVFLADLYCSGVPLSTIDFAGDFTYHAGSTTTQLYQAAVAKFDTAVALSSDSARILNLARVGKGRAYLALAQYDSAAAAVSDVPTTYVYQFQVQWASGFASGGLFAGQKVTEADTQGTNGLPYLSSGDPRTAGETWGNNEFGVPQYAPMKYGGATLATAEVILPITVASGIEARLIQAEAEYHDVATGMGNWLDELNALRQTAITPALPPLTDPGTDAERVALLFQERAYWLYLTGHRQGDLRRLIRTYGLSADAVYPVGEYPLFDQFQTYGTDVTMPIPSSEHLNPLFTGCQSRGA